MGPWPATPQIGSKRPVSTPMGSAQASALSIKAHGSPASTSGDTAADSSVPTTPADDRALGNAKVSANGKPINTLFHARSPTLTVLSERQQSFANPSWNRQSGDFSTSSDNEHGIAVTTHKHFEAVSTPETNKIGISSHIESPTRHQSSTTSFCGSPLARDFNDRGSLVAQSANVDDPFLEHRHAANDEIGATSGRRNIVVKTEGSSEFDTPSKVPESGTPYRPRQDREIEEVSSDNAQAVFPPNACVFIANLVSTSSDDQLQKCVEKAFSRFGKVYVKIKRDPRGMPFAFAQYENVDDSNRAITEGRGLVINGRQCRTERAKVNRTLYLVRVLGGPVSEREAREVLAGCGDLEKIWHCSPTEKECYRLPEGIWVTFAFFQDARDAQSQFKDHPHFRLEQPEGPYPMRLTRSSPFRAGAIYTTLNLHTTVCISNLPPDINPNQLRKMFAHVGGCGEVEVVSRPTYSDAEGYEVFAFAEFASESQAKAVCRDGYQIDDFHLRVEYGNLAEVRSASSKIANQFGSPRGRRTTGQDGVKSGHRDQCIARAAAFGLHPSVATQIYDGLGFGTDHFASPVHANPYCQPPYIPQQFGSNVGGSGEQHNNGSLYATGHASQGGAVYPYTQLHGGQYYPMLPGPYLFPNVSQNSNNGVAATASTTEPSS